MTRKKVKLAFITNDSMRKATYKKRKKGLMKKASELSTLCGIEACVIVYSPYESQPEVWPSPAGVQRVLTRFRQMPELEQTKKMMNQESFLKQRIMKATEQVKKQMKDNREKEMTQIMFQYIGAGRILHDMSLMDLNDFSWLIEQNLNDISRRMEALNKNCQNQVVVAAADGADRNKEKAQVDQVQKMEMNMDTMQKQQWFMDLMNCGGEETLPFGDVNHQNAFGPNPFFP